MQSRGRVRVGEDDSADLPNVLEEEKNGTL